MQSTFDELGIELLKYGYRKVVFLEVECKIDGTYRLGVSAELPIGDHFACPKCFTPCPCSGVLATGYSKVALPLEPEFWSGRGNWEHVSEKEYQPRRRNRGPALHYRKTLQLRLSATEESCAIV